ncbi:MAG: SET domain-containing protein-lysine N-methyltransferase [Rhodothermales bacterium]
MREFDVRTNNGFAGVYAAKAFKKGERIFPVEGPIQDFPSRYSIQIGRNRHVEAGPDNPPWKYLNHSCDPNTALDVEGRAFYALREIKAGEEIRFNYLTTEWEMATPFECHCGAPECARHIAGFKHLDGELQLRLLNEVADHIREAFGIAGVRSKE